MTPQPNAPIKVLMFGWEYPPFLSGGLGTACYGLCKGLSRNGIRISFVMPVAPEGAQTDYAKMIGTNNFPINIKPVKTLLQPYQTSKTYQAAYNKNINEKGFAGIKTPYGENLYEEVQRYTKVASTIAAQEPHDVIHVHDWMTYKAGIQAKKISGKPLVAHIHATENDRTGGNPNPVISNIEHQGLRKADLVIANSQWTKNNVIKNYNIAPEKIAVVHWGIDRENLLQTTQSFIKTKNKVVFFLGRLTIQKGVDYLIDAATIVLEHEPHTTFLISGDGDLLPSLVHKVATLGLQNNILFTGWLTGQDIFKAHQSANLFVMPSVSEPFGLVALEALSCGTPVIMSKQSGASEIVNHCCTVDFWDVKELANKITSILRDPALHHELSTNGKTEAEHFTLDEPAKKVIEIYNQLCKKG